ncbi:MAG: hypothetical protein ACI8X5_002342 [Planctomycetota bacterium]|jgi:hypothetical protein
MRGRPSLMGSCLTLSSLLIAHLPLPMRQGANLHPMLACHAGSGFSLYLFPKTLSVKNIWRSFTRGTLFV